MVNLKNSEKPAWVQIYDMRRTNEPKTTRLPGRPSAPIPRQKVGVTLSQAEITEIEVWQNRFSLLLRRKISVGETVGILTRICSGRYDRVAEFAAADGLSDLVEKMIDKG